MTRFSIIALIVFGALTPAMSSAASLVATRVIASRSVIGPQDIKLDAREVSGALRRIEDAVGREARVTLYAGRTIRAGDLTEPALIERNAIVRLRFSRGGIEIETSGRALGRGAMGDTMRVMNLVSRTVVEGRVAGAGEVLVGR